MPFCKGRPRPRLLLSIPWTRRAATMMHSKALILTLLSVPSLAQTSRLVPIVSKAVSRTVELPGEFQPFLNVSLHARVTGYVERVLVDRGSVVKQGDLLVELSAPEMQ